MIEFEQETTIARKFKLITASVEDLSHWAETTDEEFAKVAEARGWTRSDGITSVCFFDGKPWHSTNDLHRLACAVKDERDGLKQRAEKAERERDDLKPKLDRVVADGIAVPERYHRALLMIFPIIFENEKSLSDAALRVLQAANDQQNAQPYIIDAIRESLNWPAAELEKEQGK